MRVHRAVKNTGPKSIDAPRSRLRGAGVRENMRHTRQALARKRRDAEARCDE